MNTPEPCDSCHHLYFDCMTEDDPRDIAMCKVHMTTGIKSCPKYVHWMAEGRYEET